MKKIISLFLIFALIFALSPTIVRAETTTIDVSTAEEFASAISQIHESTGGDFTVNILQDLSIGGSSVIDNGNTVTILGNGHTLQFTDLNNNKLQISNATLNLGKSGSTNVLNMEGPGTDKSTQASLIGISNGTLNMYEGTSLSKNCSGETALCGGAVRVQTNATFNMYGGNIHDNKAESSGGFGGAIAMDYENAKFNMYGGTIQNNVSGTWGGAIYVLNGGQVNINGGTISNNSGVYGGAIAVTDSTVTIKNATISSNESDFGGAIISYNDVGGSNITIDNTNLTNNSSYYGGAIMSWGTSFTLSNSTITGNSANSGGGIYHNDGTFTSKNNTIKNNSANSFGGGIYSNAQIDSKNDTITENNANNAGGVYIKSNSADFSTTKVYNNKAQTAGSDFIIKPSVTAVQIIDATTMNEEAEIDGNTVPVNMWHTDEAGNRYSSSNITDYVLASDITAGTEYYLIGADGAVRSLLR